MTTSFIYNGEPNKFNDFKRVIINDLHVNNLFDHVFGHVTLPNKPAMGISIRPPEPPIKPEILIKLDLKQDQKNSPEYLEAFTSYNQSKAKYQAEYLQYLEFSDKQNKIQYQYKKESTLYYDKQGQALGIILKYLGKHVLAIIQNELKTSHPDPKNIYAIISTAFERSSEYISVTAQYHKLNSMKFNENGDAVIFIQSIEDIFDSLTGCGESLSDNFKYSIIANAFNHDELSAATRSEYKLVLNLCAHDKRSYSNLRQMITSKYLELKLHKATISKPKEKDKSSTTPTNTTKKCVWCDMTNHSTEECNILKRMKEAKTKPESTVDSPQINSVSTDRVSPDMIGLDSMASCHICNNKDILTNLQPVTNVNLASFTGAQSQCSLQGDLSTIKDVLYIPESNFSLLSLAQLRSQGFTVSYNCSKDQFYLFMNNKPITTFKNTGNLYVTEVPTLLPKLHAISKQSVTQDIQVQHINAVILDDRLNFPETLEAAARKRCIAIADCHAKFNHIHLNNLRQLVLKHEEQFSFTTKDLDNYKLYAKPCTACCKGRMKAPAHYAAKGPTTYVPGEMIVTDLFEFNTFQYIIFVDVASKYTIILPMPVKSADAIVEAVKQCVTTMHAHRVNILTVRSDSEPNYKATEDELNDMGIKLQYSAPGQHNTRAETFINIMQSAARTMLYNVSRTIPKTLTSYALQSACSTHNHMPNAAFDHLSSPIQILSGKSTFTLSELAAKPNFGDIGEFRVPKDKLTSIQERSETGYILQPLIDNSKQAVIAYIPHRRSIVHRCKFTITNNISDLGTVDNDDTSNDLIGNEDADSTSHGNHDTDAEDFESMHRRHTEDITDTSTSEVPHTSTSEVSPDQPTYWPQPQFISNVNSVKTQQLKDAITTRTFSINAVYLNQVKEDIRSSLTVKSAIQRYNDDAIEAIKTELKQLLDQHVFTPMDPLHLQPDIQLIPSQMIVKMKFLPNGQPDKIKARLVAGGHRQTPMADAATYAPTSNYTNVLINLNLASYQRKHLATIDIKGAYLHADLQSNIYMKLDKQIAKYLIQLDPTFHPFLHQDGHLVVALRKSLYGLQEAANLWYQHISTTLNDFGLHPTTNDPCLFQGQINGDHMVTNLHVDDLLISFQNRSTLESLRQCLLNKYIGLTLHEGPVINFLGLQISQSSDKHIISISQLGFIEDILLKHNITKTSSYPSTLQFYDQLYQEDTPCNQNQYASLVSSLMYLAQRSRPDILKEISLLSTRTSSPTNLNLQHLHVVCQYLSSTKLLTYDIKCTDLQVIVFADASYHCHQDRKSHTGGAIFLGDNNSAVKCISKKQTLTATSSYEAELVAIYDTYKHAKYISNSLHELVGYNAPIQWKCDNLSTISALTDPKPPNIKNSHIDVKYFFLRELIEKQAVELTHISSTAMKADFLTKSIVGDTFHTKRWWLLSCD